MIETMPPANDNAAAPASSQRIARIAVRLFLLAIMLLLVGVPVGMAWSFWVNPRAMPVTAWMAFIGVMLLLMAGFLVATRKKPD